MLRCLQRGEEREKAMECKELKRLGVQKDTYLEPSFHRSDGSEGGLVRRGENTGSCSIAFSVVDRAGATGTQPIR